MWKTGTRGTVYRAENSGAGSTVQESRAVLECSGTYNDRWIDSVQKVSKAIGGICNCAQTLDQQQGAQSRVGGWSFLLCSGVGAHVLGQQTMSIWKAKSVVSSSMVVALKDYAEERAVVAKRQKSCGSINFLGPQSDTAAQVQTTEV